MMKVQRRREKLISDYEICLPSKSEIGNFCFRLKDFEVALFVIITLVTKCN